MLFFLARSIKIQIGEINIIMAMINPNGFVYKDCITSPLNKDMTDLVDPQEGQGMPVACLIKHTSAASA